MRWTELPRTAKRTVRLRGTDRPSLAVVLSGAAARGQELAPRHAACGAAAVAASGRSPSSARPRWRRQAPGRRLRASGRRAQPRGRRTGGLRRSRRHASLPPPAHAASSDAESCVCTRSNGRRSSWRASRSVPIASQKQRSPICICDWPCSISRRNAAPGSSLCERRVDGDSTSCSPRCSKQRDDQLVLRSGSGGRSCRRRRLPVRRSRTSGASIPPPRTPRAQPPGCARGCAGRRHGVGASRRSSCGHRRQFGALICATSRA